LHSFPVPWKQDPLTNHSVAQTVCSSNDIFSAALPNVLEAAKYFVLIS
jgi:hypothetical protein